MHWLSRSNAKNLTLKFVSFSLILKSSEIAANGTVLLGQANGGGRVIVRDEKTEIPKEQISKRLDLAARAQDCQLI